MVKNKNILVDHERHQIIKIDNSKQHAFQIENAQQSRRGANVCDRNVRNRLNKMRFIYKKKEANQNLVLKYKQKKISLKWDKEKIMAFGRLNESDIQ